MTSTPFLGAAKGGGGQDRSTDRREMGSEEKEARVGGEAARVGGEGVLQSPGGSADPW